MYLWVTSHTSATYGQHNWSDEDAFVLPNSITPTYLEDIRRTKHALVSDFLTSKPLAIALLKLSDRQIPDTNVTYLATMYKANLHISVLLHRLPLSCSVTIFALESAKRKKK